MKILHDPKLRKNAIILLMPIRHPEFISGSERSHVRSRNEFGMTKYAVHEIIDHTNKYNIKKGK
jgi:hypothetical protein